VKINNGSAATRLPWCVCEGKQTLTVRSLCCLVKLNEQTQHPDNRVFGWSIGVQMGRTTLHDTNTIKHDTNEHDTSQHDYSIVSCRAGTACRPLGPNTTRNTLICVVPARRHGRHDVSCPARHRHFSNKKTTNQRHNQKLSWCNGCLVKNLSR
jgi:hypothetical protein